MPYFPAAAKSKPGLGFAAVALVWIVVAADEDLGQRQDFEHFGVDGLDDRGALRSPRYVGLVRHADEQEPLFLDRPQQVRDRFGDFKLIETCRRIGLAIADQYRG